MNTSTSKWNWKRLAGLLGSWIAYAVIFYWLCSQEFRTAVIGILALSAFTSVLTIFLAWRPLKVVSLIVAGSLLLLPVTSQAQPQTPGGDEQDFGLVECLVAVVVIGVGTVIVVGLCKIAKNIPQAPPADPDDPPVTNTPPRTNSPATNKPPIKLKLSDSSVSIWDCSTYQLANVDPAGHRYDRWFHARLESTTDLVNWSNECTIHAWVSDMNVCTVTYDRNGLAWSTNFCPIAGGTNSIPMPTITTDPKAKFFRFRDE